MKVDRVHGVLVTFQRVDLLAVTLDAVRRQTKPLDSLVVVDNDVAETARPVADAAGVEYLATGDNLGPAGGLAAGIRHVLERASENDWILFLDDDDPPPDDGTIGRLVTIIEAADPALRLGATGLVGGRYNPRTGQTERVPDDELRGLVHVEWIGGGQFPLYSVQAIREVGVPDSSLFFGFDDLEYGLRFRRKGWDFMVDGDGWLASRHRANRAGLRRSDLRGVSTKSVWRSYYSSRNPILIARQFGTRRGAFMCALHSLARASRQAVAPATRGQTRMTLLGVVHGLRGRRGRVVDPSTQTRGQSSGL